LKIFESTKNVYSKFGFFFFMPLYKLLMNNNSVIKSMKKALRVETRELLSKIPLDLIEQESNFNAK
jgi:hypothetical protein